MSIQKAPFIMLLSLLLASSLTASAQTGKVPPFRMVQSNGKIFKAENLPIGKPIIIIYFSPECDHCEKLVKELMNRRKDFEKASIAMITFLPIDKVSKFVSKYNLNKQANIYVGTEGDSNFVRNYYKIMQTPFMALYSKNGDLVKTYPKEGGLNDLSVNLKKL
jgi:thioredoxin-related protein